MKRVHPHVIPNCEDFDDPTKFDEYNASFRKDLGFREDDLLIVQPTRIVRRKRIEDSLELVHRLLQQYPDIRSRVHYIISLYQGDELDKNYVEEIQEIARQKDIPLHLIHDRVSSVRSQNEQGQKIYTNRDVLANADLITYLPIWEGFGNALLETIALKKPLVTTTYLVYKTDIKVTGLEAVEIRDTYDDSGQLVIPDEALGQMHTLLTHPDRTRQTVERNFEIAKREFSFDTLETKLRQVFAEYADEIRASRKRILKSKRSYSV